VDSVDVAELLDVNYVGVADLCADAGLVDKHLGVPRLVDQVRMNDFDCSFAGEAGGSVFARKI
jgi:hypothetical protein